jgi:hypothetical protein
MDICHAGVAGPKEGMRSFEVVIHLTGRLARRVNASRCAESESQRPEVQRAVRTAPDKAWSIPLTVLRC